MAKAKDQPGFALENFGSLMKETTFAGEAAKKPVAPRIEEHARQPGGKLIEVPNRASRSGEHKAVLTHLPVSVIKKLEEQGSGADDQKRAWLIMWAIAELERRNLTLVVRKGGELQSVNVKPSENAPVPKEWNGETLAAQTLARKR